MLLLVLNIAFIPMFVRALRIPYSVLMPLIIVFCITGAYSLNNKVWDVGTMLVFGALGYLMKKLDYSPAAMTLALVIGPLAERALRQSLIISDAGVGIFFTRPIAAVLTSMALAAVAVPVADTGTLSVSPGQASPRRRRSRIVVLDFVGRGEEIREGVVDLLDEAHDIAPVREATADGRYGKLVPVGDVEALAGAIIPLLQGERVVDTAARDWVAGHHDLGVVASRVLALLRAAAGDSTGPG